MKWLGALLRGLVAFGFRVNLLGRPLTDCTARAAAATILHPGEQRDWLTSGIFVLGDPFDAVGRLDRALDLTTHSRPVVEKIERAAARQKLRGPVAPSEPDEARKARSAQPLKKTTIDEAIATEIINRAEAALLRKAKAAQRATIEVDSFTLAEYLGRGVTKTREASRVAEPVAAEV